jgi:hypothetical protein
MHALVFNKVTHRIIAGHGQPVLLAIEAVDQIEENFGFEIRHFQLVDVVPEQMLGLKSGCCSDNWRHKVVVEFGAAEFFNKFPGRSHVTAHFS